MTKTLLYHIFGAGKIPKGKRATLESEGIVLADEGVGGSVTYKRYRALGKRFLWKRRWFTGSVVLTKKRLTAFAFSKRLINVPLDAASLSCLKVSVKNDRIFCIAFEASDFHDNQSGSVECRWSTPKAEDFAKRLR